jgi:hypothetical protein
MTNSAYIPHQGMPPIDYSGKPLSYFEFWPMWAFYPPLIVYVLWLMVRYRGILLPTAANPSFPSGGFVGESKSEILNLAIKAIPEWVAPFVVIHRPEAAFANPAIEAKEAIALMHADGIDFPVVAKPDLGCRGVGVKVVRDEAALVSYLQSFPAGADFLLQKLIAYEGEAGIFYCRLPGQSKGKLVSITLKYFPFVTGDGKRTLRQLILDDPRAGQLPHLYLHRHAQRLDTIPTAGENIRLAFAGSHSRGAIFRNGTHLVTPEMEARFEEIAQRLPNFFFGRFDIRFEDFEAVRQGKGFVILEANGAGAESTHIWDRDTSLIDAWKDLMRQYRWLFQIAYENRRNGFKPMGFREFYKSYRREKELTKQYPATD